VTVISGAGQARQGDVGELDVAGDGGGHGADVADGASMRLVSTFTVRVRQ
jgi:hypothetical protein